MRVSSSLSLPWLVVVFVGCLSGSCFRMTHATSPPIVPYTAEACEASGGTVTFDIGNGAIYKPWYRCETNNRRPLYAIYYPPDTVNIPIEGAVCCGPASPSPPSPNPPAPTPTPPHPSPPVVGPPTTPGDMCGVPGVDCPSRFHQYDCVCNTCPYHLGGSSVDGNVWGCCDSCYVNRFGNCRHNKPRNLCGTAPPPPTPTPPTPTPPTPTPPTPPPPTPPPPTPPPPTPPPPTPPPPTPSPPSPSPPVAGTPCGTVAMGDCPPRRQPCGCHQCPYDYTSYYGCCGDCIFNQHGRCAAFTPRYMCPTSPPPPTPTPPTPTPPPPTPPPPTPPPPTPPPPTPTPPTPTPPSPTPPVAGMPCGTVANGDCAHRYCSCRYCPNDYSSFFGCCEGKCYYNQHGQCTPFKSQSTCPAAPSPPSPPPPSPPSPPPPSPPTPTPAPPVDCYGADNPCRTETCNKQYTRCVPYMTETAACQALYLDFYTNGWYDGQVVCDKGNTGIDCKPGAPQAACLADPCDSNWCETDPGAICIADYCGGCGAVFINWHGQQVCRH